MKNLLLYTLLILPHFLFAQFISRGTGITESGRSIISMSTVDEQTAWAVTFDGITFNTPTNEWMRTTDGGETWDTGGLPFSNPNFATYCIYAFDNLTAFVSAGTQPNFTEGAIYKTTDGGQTWTEQFFIDDRTPGEFFFWDENEGMTFGFARTAPNEVVIYRTEDGGDNWQTIEIPDILPGEWCAGYSANGLIDSQGDQVWVTTVFGRILHSADRGLTWETVQVAPAGRALLGVAFADEMNGIAVSPAFSSGAAAPNMAFRTSDGGATWEEITIPANPIAGSLEYVPGTEGTYLFSNVIFGETNIAYTHDSGDTWHLMDGPGLWAIDFKSPTAGWIGGNITSATKGGMYRFTSKLSPEQANVTTLAGTYTEGYRLGAAQNAQFYNPKGMDIDDEGNVYVMDQYSNSIKKIGVDGEVTLVAGENDIFDRPDFNNPEGILILPDGNLLATSNFNSQIMHIDLSTPEPEVTVFAGTGTYGLDDGPLDEATFATPRALTGDDAGNIYVADDVAVRIITPDGMVSTLAGGFDYGFVDGNGPEARFNVIWGIDADAEGNVYAADAFNHAIRKISPTGEVTTLSGSGFPGYQDGTADVALFAYPEDVVVDGEGNLLVADGTNGVIRKIDLSDSTVSTIVGQKTPDYFPGSPGPSPTDGDGSLAIFSRMRGLAMRSNGNLLVSEWGSDLVREIEMGKPSHPLMVVELNMDNPYLTGHVRHLKPYDFQAVIQNMADFNLSEVEMKVTIRKGGTIVFSESSAVQMVPAQSFEVFEISESFLPEDAGIFEVQLEYLHEGKVFSTSYRDITISDQVLDYTDGLVYSTGSYLDFLSDFQGGYGIDFEIENPDSLSGIEVGFFTLDSVEVEAAVWKMEWGLPTEKIYASGMVSPDSFAFLNGISVWQLPQAIYLEAGHYLFSFQESVPGNTVLIFDNDVVHGRDWITRGTEGNWEKLSAIFGETIPHIIRPVFGNPEIMTSTTRTLASLPLVSASPNPFADVVHVTLPAAAERPVILELVNLEGKLLEMFRVQPGETVSKNWEALPSGMYLLSFEVNGRRGGMRLVKK